jgi:hypothetical protein
MDFCLESELKNSTSEHHQLMRMEIAERWINASRDVQQKDGDRSAVASFWAMKPGEVMGKGW